MVNILKQLVSDTTYKYGNDNGKKYITIHETANTTKGADAQAHADLQSKPNPRAAAWHWQVDDAQAIQSFTHDFQLWHAGDGRGDGNLNSIAIEICVNSDGDFDKATRNAAELAKHIADAERIHPSKIVQHNHWSVKNCPHTLRDGGWDAFKALVSDTKPEPSNNTVSDKEYTGNSIVDYLNHIGKDASFSARKRYAHAHGIDNYIGSAEQNLLLLDLMRNGEKDNRRKKYNSNYTGGSIVDFLKSVGLDSSFNNRQYLAQTYGIKGYTGTVEQNVKLLKLMRK